MPYNLLSHLSRTVLPTEVTEQEDIHKLLSLSAAGLVKCDFSQATHTVAGRRLLGPAVVREVTAEGMLAVKKMAQKRILPR